MPTNDPLQHAIDHPPQLDEHGRYTDGVFQGMTPAEVAADKRRFEESQASGGGLLASIKRALKGE